MRYWAVIMSLTVGQDETPRSRSVELLETFQVSAHLMLELNELEKKPQHFSSRSQIPRP